MWASLEVLRPLSACILIELTMVDHKNSEAKLLEISREANKLTQMIHSWPKTSNIDSRLKDITKDLMKGASGLQESLITLGKMSRPKEKLDLDFTRGSGRFERLAMDGSLFNYIDELNKLIRESGYSHRHGIVYNDDEKVSSSRSLGLLMKKEKGPNLIAKLMGLEELPSGFNNRAIKETTDDVCLVQQKSLLAIEMPKTRMLTSMGEKPEPRTKKTVKDIVEIVKSKEVLETDEIKKHKRMPRSVPCIDNEAPTDVLVRTPQFPCLNPEFDRIVVLKKTQATNPIPEKVVCSNRQTLSRKSERKEVKNVQKNIVIPYQKTANLASIDRQQQKGKVLTSTSIKGNASPKKLMNGRKPEDRKELKVVAAPKSQAKLISKAPAKSDKKSSINKDISTNEQLMVCKGSIASRKHNETYTIKPMPRNFTNAVTVKKKTEAKLIRKSMDIKAVAGNANCKDVQVTNRSFNYPVDAPAKRLEQNSKPFNTEHKTSKASKLSCEAMLKNSKVDRSSSSSKESIKLSKNKTNIQTATKEEVDIQVMLLSSQCFLSHAQELFGLDGYQTTNHLQVKTRNAKLLFDCVKEFMVRKNNGIELSKHQMLQTSLRSTAVVSIDCLVDEISHGIEKLNGYRKNDVGISLKDGIYVTLEKDIRCKDVMLNAMWDMGWVNWICVEEADIVVGQVEDSILYGLVKELVEELVLSDSSL